MPMRASKRIRRLLAHWPGRERFGVYRFLPLFFVLGAGLEFSMINWHVGEVNFCKFINKILHIFLHSRKFNKLASKCSPFGTSVLLRFLNIH